MAQRRSRRPGSGWSRVWRGGGRARRGGAGALLLCVMRDWEPRGALVSGPEGLDVLSRIPEEASRLLWPGGLLAIEMAPPQTKAFADSLDRQRAFDSIRVLKDFQGLDRIVVARRWKNS